MRKPLLITVLIVAVVASSWYAFANDRKVPRNTKAELLDEATLTLVDENAPLPEMNDDDKKILSELEHLFAKATEQSFYMEGNLSVKDPSDSAGNASGDFSFYRKGQLLWYKNADQEMVNTQEYYAVADHSVKRVVVTPSKNMEETSPMPLNVIGKNLLSEGYTIERTEKDGVSVIRLVNENHISCKEIRVEFDAATQHPSLFFYRFTNLDQPDDVAADKIMSIRIKAWENGKDVQTRGLPDIVRHKENAFQPGQSLQGYEIIDLYTK